MSNSPDKLTDSDKKPLRFTRRAKILGGLAAGAVGIAGTAVGIAELQDHVKTPGQIVQNEEVQNGQIPSPTPSETHSAKPKPTDVHLGPATQNLHSHTVAPTHETHSPATQEVNPPATADTQVGPATQEVKSPAPTTSVGPATQEIKSPQP